MSTLFAASKDGTRIAYETVGTGPALVLVDGALCSRDFGPCRSMAGHLAGQFSVTIYDRRGRGESGNAVEYAPEREYEDLAAVIAAVGGNAYVLGYSSGGALALQAAASGVAMRKVASYEAPYVGADPEKDHLAALDARLAKGDRAGAVGYFMVDMVGGPWFLPLIFKLMPKVGRQLQAVAPTLLHDATIMGSWEAPVGTLAKVRVPTLVLGGGKAKANMAQAVADVAGAVPGALHRILPGQTHQVSDEALAPELVDFFR